MENEPFNETERAVKPRSEFEKGAAELRGGNVLNDFLGLLRHNQKWWLLPILVSLLLLGFLIVLSGTAVAPLIYTLF